MMEELEFCTGDDIRSAGPKVRGTRVLYWGDGGWRILKITMGLQQLQSALTRWNLHVIKIKS